MASDYHREFLVRLPLPLSQLYARAHNGKDIHSRHQNTFYLFEVAIKLAVSVLVAAYRREIELGTPRRESLDARLQRLACPAFGDWLGLMRELAWHYANQDGHPMRQIWEQLTQEHDDRPGLLDLYLRTNGVAITAARAGERCSLLQVIEALAPYRQVVIGQGAGREERFRDEELGPRLFPAANELLADGVFDLLGPPGSRLVYLTDLRTVDPSRVECALWDLVGTEGERADDLSLDAGQAGGLSPKQVAVVWPGRPRPLALDPLTVFREDDGVREIRFLNSDLGGKHAEYLSYNSGKTDREGATVQSLDRLLALVAGTEHLPVKPSLAAAESGARSEFKILGRIGAGGMGVVSLARQISLGRLVAIKTLTPELAGDRTALARFRREIELMARCDDPHIVKVLTSGKLPDGQTYYAMEYVPGADLHTVFKCFTDSDRQRPAAELGAAAWSRAVLAASRQQRERTATLAPILMEHELQWDAVTSERPADTASGAVTPSDETLPLPARPAPGAHDQRASYERCVALLARDAARALQTVHERGLIHRDVKPSNLMLTPDGKRVVLMDFGLAKGAMHSLTDAGVGTLMGTLRYAAPEQLAAANVPVDARADIRGLGVTCWELLTRRRLFADADDEVKLASCVLHRDVPRLRAIDATFDRDLEAIVAKATERSAADRIGTARELADYLDLYLAGKPLPIRVPGIGELSWRWARRHSAAVAATVIAVVSLAVWGVHRYDEGQRQARLHALREAFTVRLDYGPTTPECWRRMDGILAEISRIAPSEAAERRQELGRQFADRLDKQIEEQPRLDLDLFGECVDLLASTSPERANGLKMKLTHRTPKADLLFDLHGPFVDVAGVFAEGVVPEADGCYLVRTSPSPPGIATATKFASAGDVELEATWADDDWTAAVVRIVLDAARGGDFAGVFAELTGRRATARGGKERLRIVKGNLVLREREIDLPNGALKLLARRSGAAFEVQVNDLPPLRFVDLFPTPPVESGVFALAWPEGARLESTRAWKRSAEKRSLLEQGDLFFAEGKYRDAIKVYDEQAARTTDRRTNQELRYRKARCQLALDDRTTAATMFEELAIEEGSPWPPLAACDLCRIRLNQKEWDKANVALAKFYHYASQAEGLDLVLDRVQSELLDVYVPSVGSDIARQVRIDAQAIGRWVELAEMIERQVDLPSVRRFRTTMRLAEAYDAMGLDQQAEPLFKRLLERRDVSGVSVTRLVGDYIWLLLRNDRAEEALSLLDQLEPGPGPVGPTASALLLERARVLAALDRTAESLRLLDQLLGPSDGDTNVPDDDVTERTDAWILKGFITSPEAQAVEVWKEGYRRLKTPERMSQLGVSIIGSLSREMSDDDAQQMLDRVAGRFGEQFPIGKLVSSKLFGLPEALPALRDMWSSPRGRQYARSMAFRRISVNDYYVIQIPLSVAEVARKGAFDDALPTDAEDWLWATMIRLLREYQQKRLSLADMTMLFLSWRGELGKAGWEGVAARLDPPLRGPLAFIFACHLRRMGKTQDAPRMLDEASRTAQEDAVLARLIAEERAKKSTD